MSFLFSLPASVQALLDVDNFLPNTTTSQFVELLYSLQASLQSLDPKPHIRAFEAALKELENKSRIVQERVGTAQQEVLRAEVAHAQNVLTLTGAAAGSELGFVQLDAVVQETLQQLEALGARMRLMAAARDAAQQDAALVAAYAEFAADGRLLSVAALVDSTEFGARRQGAALMRRLHELAAKVADGNANDAAVRGVSQAGLAMERRALGEFEAMYRSDEYGVMSELAAIMAEWDLEALVAAFVAMLGVFGENRFEGLGDALVATAAAIKEPLEEALSKTGMALRTELRVVRKVFTSSVCSDVVVRLVQRCTEELAAALALLFEHAAAQLRLQHAALVHQAYTAVHQWFDDLGEFFAENEFENAEAIATSLTRCGADLFAPHVVRLSERELGAWQEVLGDNTVLPPPMDADISLADEVAKLTGASATRRRWKSLVGKYGKRRAALEPVAAGARPEIDVANVSATLVAAAALVRRVADLAALPDVVAAYCGDLVDGVLSGIGASYIDTVLHDTYARIRVQEATPDADVDLVLLGSISRVGELLLLLRAFFSQVILPATVNSPSVRERSSRLWNEFVTRLEESVNLILVQTVRLVLAGVTARLARQQKRDFLRETIEADDTAACEAVLVYVTHAVRTMQQALAGPNLERVLVRLGSDWLKMLLAHFKKFQVNETGALVLTKDVSRYVLCVGEWGIEEVTASFGVLREVATLFSVHPDLLESLVHEGRLGGLTRGQVDEYVLRRADTGKSGVMNMLRGGL